MNLFGLLHSTCVTFTSNSLFVLVTAAENVKARVAVSPQLAPISTYTVEKNIASKMFEKVFFLLCWPAFSPQMVGIIWAVDTWEAIKLAIVICRILFDYIIISLWHQMCQDSHPHYHWHYRLSQLWWTFQSLTVACKHLKKEKEIKFKIYAS